MTLASLEVATLPASDAACLTMPAGSGTYLIVPQFASGAQTETAASYEIGTTSGGTVARVASELAGQPGSAGPRGLQSTFDHTLRAREHTLAAVPSAREAAMRVRSAIRASVTPPVLGSTRSFQVCGNLNCSTFVTDTAMLQFAGANVLLYLGQHAAPPPNGFTTQELAALGTLFDQTLYGIDVDAFGPATDIDGNGRIIVLMSPTVNAITPASTCASEGYVAGFVYGVDLLPSEPHSNGGEIFYTIAPDPLGTVSCAHTKQTVLDGTGATFLHEMLHLINFGEKVLIHQLSTNEQEFLDEGMAKIAEELGAKYYEARYPPPTGRTNPQQLFPDSAEGFISGDQQDSYSYLLNPASSSAARTQGASTIAEAGAEWLFLRWLIDQKGEPIKKAIVTSDLVGIPNIEAQAGESYPQLFADFALALYTDSLSGVSRDQVPARDRYVSHNLRELYAALFRAVNGPTGDIPRPFPISLRPLLQGGTLTSSMLQGTVEFFTYAVPPSGQTATLRFTGAGGAALSTDLGAQISIFRCPSAGVCTQ